MAEASSYSAANVSLTYLGKAIVGFADGDDAIVAERSVVTMSKIVGMQGDAVFSQSADRSGTIKLKLLQNSSANEFLTAKAAANEAGALVSGPMICTEVGSDSGFTANKCIIEGAPKISRGAGHNVVEWSFLCADLNLKHGAGVSL